MLRLNSRGSQIILGFCLMTSIRDLLLSSPTIPQVELSSYTSTKSRFFTRSAQIYCILKKFEFIQQKPSLLDCNWRNYKEFQTTVMTELQILGGKQIWYGNKCFRQELALRDFSKLKKSKYSLSNI